MKELEKLRKKILLFYFVRCVSKVTGLKSTKIRKCENQFKYARKYTIFPHNHLTSTNIYCSVKQVFLFRCYTTNCLFF